MVRYCYICKIGKGEVKDVSFHSIPKNEKVRVKWVEALGRKLTKNTVICSRHFNESTVYYKKYGDSIKRFLLPQAVPSMLCKPCDSKHAVTENDKILPHSSSTDNQTEKYETTDDSKSTTSVCINDESLNEIVILDDKSITGNVKSSTVKRNAQQPLSGAKRFCNPRAVGDLRREDFSSETSWQLVQTHLKECKKKTKVLNQKVKRLTKRIETLQKLLTHLKNNGLLPCEGSDALEVSNCSCE